MCEPSWSCGARRERDGQLAAGCSTSDGHAFEEKDETHLIGHDHEAAVAQRVGRGVRLALLEAHDLLDGLDLGVVEERLAARLAHVEQLAAQREHAVVVAPDDGEARHGERLRRVSLGEDERALGPVAGAGVVGVLELDEARDAVEAGVRRVSAGSVTLEQEEEEEEEREGRTESAWSRPSS